MRKTAFLIPVYEKHFKELDCFVDSFEKYELNSSSDLIIVFTTSKELEIWNSQYGRDSEYLKFLVLPKELQGCKDRALINIKKFFGLYENKGLYDYIIVVDAESEIVKKTDIYSVCEEFYKRKELYGNQSVFDTKIYIKASFRELRLSKSQAKAIDTDLYLWFNNLCIYKTEYLDDFFRKIRIPKRFKKVPALAFDYNTFMYYLIAYKQFKIVDMEVVANNAMLESWWFEAKSEKYRRLKYYHCNPYLVDKIPNKDVFLFIQKDQKPKRLAIQLFGHLRTYKACADSFRKNVVDVNYCKQYGFKVDVFIHTWSEKDHNTINWRGSEEKTILEALTVEDIHFIKEKYDPKKIKVDEQLPAEKDAFTELNSGARREYKGVLNNAYTIYKANELREQYEKETGVAYDYVLVTRPDIYFRRPLDIHRMLSSLENANVPIEDNRIFYAYNNAPLLQDSRVLKGTDIIFWGSSSAISVATSLFRELPRLFDKNSFYSFEHWWYSYWESKGLLPTAMKYLLGRDWLVIYGPEDIASHVFKKKKMFGITVLTKDSRDGFIRYRLFGHMQVYKRRIHYD